MRNETVPNHMSEKRLELVRGLGPWASAAIVVGTMVGTGIFLKPSEMAREGRFVSIVFAAWIVGALLSIFGALAFAELGAAIPEAGGEYAYLRRGFGPIWGFLFGWMHSIVGRPSSAASIAAGMMRFLSFFVPAVAAPLFTVHIAIPGLTHWVPPYDFVFTWAQPFAVFWLLVMTGINYLGVRLGGEVQVFLTSIKVLSIVLIIGVAFLLPTTGSHPPDPLWPSSASTGLLTAFLAALAAALWAYDGWEDLNLVGSELKDPQRNFPRALVGGVCFVALLYLLFSAACLKVLPFSAVATSQHVASDVVERVIGHGVASWITLAMVLSALGSMNSSVLSGARVPYAMARDGIFFKVADGIHPKYRTPGRALIFQGSSGERHGALRNIRRAHQSFYFCRLDFLRICSCGYVPLAQDGTQHGAPVPLLGLSLGARPVRSRRSGAHHQPLARSPGPIHHRTLANSCRPALLSVLDQTQQG